jgi:hypothetical protein
MRSSMELKASVRGCSSSGTRRVRIGDRSPRARASIRSRNARQRPQALGQAKPDQDDRKRDDHELRQDDAGDDLVGELRAFLGRLSDFDQHPARRWRTRLEQIHEGDAQVLPAILVIAKKNLAGFACSRNPRVARYGSSGSPTINEPSTSSKMKVDVVDLVRSQEAWAAFRQCNLRLPVDETSPGARSPSLARAATDRTGNSPHWWRNSV